MYYASTASIKIYDFISFIRNNNSALPPVSLRSSFISTALRRKTDMHHD
jgi:hypothetical protein